MELNKTLIENGATPLPVNQRSTGKPYSFFQITNKNGKWDLKVETNLPSHVKTALRKSFRLTMEKHKSIFAAEFSDAKRNAQLV
jgi:hypothetical protein